LTDTPINYFKVDVEYIQESQLLVAAEDAEKAKALVQENVLETTKGFKINGVTELSDEEKLWVVKNMQGDDEASTPMNEIQDTRTIN
jgi:hypothetical protein